MVNFGWVVASGLLASFATFLIVAVSITTHETELKEQIEDLKERLRK